MRSPHELHFSLVDPYTPLGPSLTRQQSTTNSSSSFSFATMMSLPVDDLFRDCSRVTSRLSRGSMDGWWPNLHLTPACRYDGSGLAGRSRIRIGLTRPLVLPRRTGRGASAR